MSRKKVIRPIKGRMASKYPKGHTRAKLRQYDGLFLLLFGLISLVIFVINFSMAMHPDEVSLMALNVSLALGMIVMVLLIINYWKFRKEAKQNLFKKEDTSTPVDRPVGHDILFGEAYKGTKGGTNA